MNEDVALRDAAWARLLAALGDVDATSPTLCAGWTAHHLAAHLWVLKHEPLGWAAMVVPGAEQPYLARLVRRRAYADLLEALRREDGHVAAMPNDAREGHRHALGEFFVHGEDVRRANGLPPAIVDERLSDALAARVVRAGRQLNALRRDRLVLRRPDGREAVLARGWPGAGTTTVTGAPGELLLWVHGRRDTARVTVE